MANINVTHLDTNKLHPVYVQYDGQLTPQPAFIEHDTRDNTLVAGYSGEIGGGVPEDVWNGKRRRYKINIDLTENEINTLLDEVGLMLSNDVEADVEQVCEFRITDSHGIYDVADWMEGIDPCDEYGITADSTDDDLETIGAAMINYATGEGCTITGVSDYCKQLRDDLRRSKEQ